MEDEKCLLPEEDSSGNFSDAGYEVVRSQFFSQSAEPAVTFGRQKMWVNSVCLTKLPEANHIQILVNRDTKTLTLRPSQENDADALPWCSTGNRKRKPRRLSCPVFFAMVCALMKWNPDYRYRITGKHLCESEEELLAFDLRSAEAYVYGDHATQRYTPRFPSDWRDRFGIPAAEHSIEPLIHIFDEYAVFELDLPATRPDTPTIQKLEGEDKI